MGAGAPIEETAHTLEGADGSRLGYWMAGHPKSPTAVLTHGAGADHRMFDPQIPALVGAGYRTVRWDVRYQDVSSVPTGRFRLDQAAEDLRALLNDAGVSGPVVLLGQSMGGNISQEYLRRRPEEVSAMVVIGSTSNTLSVTRGERYRLALSRPFMRVIPYGRLTRWMARASAEEPGAQEYLREAFATTGRREFLRIWDGMTRAITPVSNYRVDTPQLLICGEKDATGNIRTAMQRWSERDAHSAFHVIPGAGHVANLDRPDEVNRLIVAFLKAEISRNHD